MACLPWLKSTKSWCYFFLLLFDFFSYIHFCKFNDEYPWYFCLTEEQRQEILYLSPTKNILFLKTFLKSQCVIPELFIFVYVRVNDIRVNGKFIHKIVFFMKCSFSRNFVFKKHKNVVSGLFNPPSP